LIRPVSNAAAKWLRSGFLEDIAFCRVEFLYHTALLTYMARQGAGFCASDMAVMQRLCEGRLIGRSEMPVLSQKLIGAYFSRSGIDCDFGTLGRRNLQRMVDKRILRGRPDEYDILVLLMCAQLLHLEYSAGHEAPSLYPHVLLLEAIRCANMNWLAVLTFLCARWFGLPVPLRNAVWCGVSEHLPAEAELLPLPTCSRSDSAYIERAGRGLRIRSTVALLSSLYTLGDSYADARALA
jgi:hypothetical protein